MARSLLSREARSFRRERRMRKSYAEGVTFLSPESRSALWVGGPENIPSTLKGLYKPGPPIQPCATLSGLKEVFRRPANPECAARLWAGECNPFRVGRR